MNIIVLANHEHVPTNERCIRTVKERTRAHHTTTPFTHLPPALYFEMVYHSVVWLTMFASNKGIHTTLSPSEIILGRKLDFNAYGHSLNLVSMVRHMKNLATPWHLAPLAPLPYGRPTIHKEATTNSVCRLDVAFIVNP